MEESIYQHFIITRFNLVFNQFKHDKSGNKTQTEEWLQQRFDLFDCFCFPSIANQNTRKFKWLVLFSINTPDFFKKKIDKYSAVFSNFIPVYLEDGENMLARLSTEISGFLIGNESHLITTRIDNDDAFHQNIINLIQQEFEGQENLYLNFNNGIQYDIDNKVLCKFDSRDNPFISRIEKINRNDFKTVLEKRHSAVYGPGVMKYIHSHPVWLQIIHAGNLANVLYMNRLLLSPAVIKEFNIKYPIKISRGNSFRLFLKYIINRISKKAAKVFK